jgi:hypothetical protein
MLSSFEIVVLVVLVTVSVWRTPYAWEAPRHRPLWAIFTTLAVVYVLGRPAVARAIDHLTGINNVTTLCKHLLGLYLCVAIVAFVHVVTHERDTPDDVVETSSFRQISPYPQLAAVVGLILTVLFALMPRHTEVEDFLTYYADEPLVAVYWTVWLAFLAAALGRATWLFWREAGHGTAPARLRGGLYVSAAGTFIGVLYAVHKAAYTLTHAAGISILSSTTSLAITRLLMSLSVLLALVGTCTLQASELLTQVRNRRALWRLAPLWNMLVEVNPDIRLRLTEPKARRNSSLLLHRRVIEIRDGLLFLRDYMTPEIADRAHRLSAGVPEPKRAAVIQALELVGAKSAHAGGAMPAPTAYDIPFVSGDSAVLEAPELAPEVEWLGQVAWAVRSRPVRGVLSHNEGRT